MTALSGDKNTLRMGNMLGDSPNPIGVKANARIYGGALCVNDGGVAAPGRTATGLVPLGVARKRYDNTGGADNAIQGEFDHGAFLFVNDGTDPVVAADIGSDCYISDDQTVCHTGTGKSRAGKVLQINPTNAPNGTLAGVVVRIGTGF